MTRIHAVRGRRPKSARHEIAGKWGTGGARALWRFSRGTLIGVPGNFRRVYWPRGMHNFSVMAQYWESRFSLPM